MIWGNLNSSRYVPEVLQPEVDPFFQGSPRANFQQSNKRPRVSKAVLYFCSAQQKQLLFWPACSPDLSPIEHVWDLVISHLDHDRNLAASKHEFWPRIQAELCVCVTLW